MSDHLDPRVFRRLCGGVLSVALHAVLLLIMLSGGRTDGVDAGDAPSAHIVFVEAAEATQSRGAELPPLEPAVPTMPGEERLHAAIARLVPQLADAIAPEAGEDAELSLPEEQPPADGVESLATIATELPSTVAMSRAEQATLARRLERLAEESIEASWSEVAWEQDGRKYTAVLRRERAQDGTALERVVAEVAASDGGKRLTTLVNLKRLAFSQFTQLVDRWDPGVQLHDDEIAGRFHSNSEFSLHYDSYTAPRFLGRVTTAATGFVTESRGGRREADIFRGGVETRAGRIRLPKSLQPSQWAPPDGHARIHELAGDTSIRFFADGYALRPHDSEKTEYFKEPAGHPVYFVATRGAVLYVKGVVAGQVLVYSPRRIVIEGSLTYASHPREDPESDDYLGLVSDRLVEVAPPTVTGLGDLEIDAAIFARRSFAVTDIDFPATATLRIYGSVAAGTLTATEPRYATKIDYDGRFENRRPPGFPSTNRHEVADWDGHWMAQ